MVNPQFPIYIPSKDRPSIAKTPKAFDLMRVPYRIVVEESQYEDYCRRYPPERLVILDPQYQRDYETLDDLGDTMSKGSGPARNFIWELSKAEGHAWHWVVDDNIHSFRRHHLNTRQQVADGTIFAAMEDFVLRYKNVAMAGPHYETFVPARAKVEPFITGTRVFSCNLIRNDLSQRWRGRYNEDAILSLDLLKAGWATVLFQAFLAKKRQSQEMRGGNTTGLYSVEGTGPKSQMLVREHPDVAEVVWRYGRWHHHVDYSRWLWQPLILRDDYVYEDKSYKFSLVHREGVKPQRTYRPGQNQKSVPS